jgi:hypothetical protein
VSGLAEYSESWELASVTDSAVKAMAKKGLDLQVYFTSSSGAQIPSTILELCQEDPTDAKSYPVYKASPILPVLYQRKARCQRNKLLAYLSESEGRFKLWEMTVTEGCLCTVEGISKSINKLRTRCFNLNRCVWFSGKAELIAAAFEFTVKVQESGQVLYHVHTHAIFRTETQLTKKLKRKIQNYFIGWSGIELVAHPAAFVCYAHKAPDLSAIQHRGEELIKLHHNLKGVHFFDSYNEFRAFCGSLKNENVVPKLQHPTNGGLGKWVQVRRRTKKKQPSMGDRGAINRIRADLELEKPQAGFCGGLRNVFLGYTVKMASDGRNKIYVRILNLEPTIPIERCCELLRIPKWRHIVHNSMIIRQKNCRKSGHKQVYG